MLLSVIIVSYIKIDILRDCLDSIKKFNDIGEELEVIVSDNSPDYTLYDRIKREYDWVKLVKNENNGFGAGNNRGYEISSGKYLLFLNPDTVLVEPVFKFAAEKFERDEDLALFGVQLLNANGGKNISYYGIDGYGICSTLYMKLCRGLNIFKDGKMFISGADLFVRRESFEQAGLFDEKIFMYKEESDLIKRIKLCSDAKKTKFFRDRRIIHLEGGTENSDDEQKVSQYKRILQSDKYYAEKWGISLIEIYRQKRRYQAFKMAILACLFKRKDVELQKKLIKALDDEIYALKK